MKILRKMSWLELKLFASEPITVLFTLALPLVILHVLGGVFGSTPNPDYAVSARSTTTCPPTSGCSSPRSA